MVGRCCPIGTVDSIGVGDRGKGALAPPPKKIREKIFFRQNHEKIQAFC